jgi:hypothetical protein
MGVSGTESVLAVPDGYVSGTDFSSSSTFDGLTLAELGVTPCVYTYSWGSGPDADSLTVNIGVPEPSTLDLAGIAALASLGRWSRYRVRR